MCEVLSPAEGTVTEYLLFNTDKLDTLALSCARFAPDSDIYLAPGQQMSEALQEHRAMANGRYALLLVDGPSGEMMAVSGFDIPDNETMLIKHSPQGARGFAYESHVGNVSRSTRRRLLRRTSFRQEMIEAACVIALRVHRTHVVGISAENHPQVLNGSLDYEKGKIVVNRQFELAGFYLGEDKNYHKNLAYPRAFNFT